MTRSFSTAPTCRSAPAAPSPSSADPLPEPTDSAASPDAPLAPPREEPTLDPESSSRGGNGFRAWLNGDGAKFRNPLPGRTNWLGNTVSTSRFDILHSLHRWGNFGECMAARDGTAARFARRSRTRASRTRPRSQQLSRSRRTMLVPFRPSSQAILATLPSPAAYPPPLPAPSALALNFSQERER